ncbi:MAG: hypothetical protein ACLP01_06640 [Solirubrobacteraceae bacterium]
MTITPQPATTAHAAWLARTKPAELPAMIAPVTATPTAAPIWRQVEAIAPATPAWSSGMPESAALVIGGLTRPEPAPKTR